ncbi:cell division protein ZapA [Peptoniphilus sp. GNH]|nr:cell division protein ZapA [Clostridiales bacterium KA00134]UHR03391.1 cell division protein ZapA [Peptoniphilus sp. GNH]
MKKEPIKVEIDDMQFKVVGNDDASYVKLIAQKLDDLIKKYKNANFRLNQAQVLVLAGLNVMDQLEKTSRVMEEVRLQGPDGGKTVDSIKEINELNDRIRSLEENDKLKSAEIKKLQEEIENHRQGLLEKLGELSEIRDEKNKLLEKEEIFKKELDAKASRILDLQKEVVDLTRELENLTGLDRQ